MEKIKSTSSRGGSRPGSGRKKMDQGEKKITVGFRLRPEQKDRLFHVAEERGMSASELVARMIEQL